LILNLYFETVLLHGYIGNFGVTIGSHRLWSHKTFKAKLPLQILLAYCQTAAGQLSIFQWCRDHRLHHKFSDTFADPYSTRRGLFFSHMGWLLQKEHPLCKEMEKNIPLSDLNDDPVIRIQAKYELDYNFIFTKIQIYIRVTNFILLSCPF
jgi:stearoyl-CoA desaturase (delta-9 desaturase)